jgi:flagellar hook-length control protein FliK
VLSQDFTVTKDATLINQAPVEVPKESLEEKLLGQRFVASDPSNLQASDAPSRSSEMTNAFGTALATNSNRSLEQLRATPVSLANNGDARLAALKNSVDTSQLVSTKEPKNLEIDGVRSFAPQSAATVGAFAKTQTGLPTSTSLGGAPQLARAVPNIHDVFVDMGKNGQSFSQQSENKGEGRDFGGRAGIESLGSLGLSAQGLSHLGSTGFHSHLTNGGGISNGSELTMTPQQRTDFIQKVLDQATASIKDGSHGTVKIDLGSSELGHIEMAVSMQNEKLDLKIMTASERTRDLLAGELNRLRDALSVQNVQLGQVDVGVGGRHPQQQHSGQHNPFQGFANQGGFNNQAFGEGGRGSHGDFRQAPRLSTPAPIAAVFQQPLRTQMPLNYGQGYNQTGRIEVRV